ncbi:SDR family oxidoreductase [Selenomonas sp. AE3005]|uniref:SDR family oxidoreductase n=1 Tax=Selenomonas sp. AE3005 TaxID=1485543 RepID=UPI00048499B5|nr:SDR family oxidoreductase [Selenomonas sp. AE3005]
MVRDSVKNIFSLTGKTVLITGGAGHLGQAMSEALVAFGAKLFILGHDEGKNKRYADELNLKYPSADCEAIKYDLDDDISIGNALSKVLKRTGRIDVLINNSAYSCAKALHEYEFEEWQKGLSGTINGVFRMVKQVLPIMMKQKYGNIINIGSMYGMVAPNMEIYGDSGQNNPANYGAGKAAIIQLTKYIACTYAKNGIRANSISPGPFPNPEVQKNAKFIGELCRKNPMSCIGQPEDLQGIVIYLASDASRYTTGQNIAVDGGWTAW